MRKRLALLVVLAIGVLGVFAASPASADPALVFNSPGNSHDGVALCNFIDDTFAPGPDGTYPYTMTVTTPGGVVGPITVENKGGCVSTLAKNQDWTVVVAVS
jgi:hypothetical protein